MIENNFLPTRYLKARPFFLIILIIILYLIENLLMISYLDSRFIYYIIKPILWLALAYTVWMLPKVRAKGRLKLRSTVNWWAFNFALIYIIISALAGMIDGFGKSPYSQTPFGITTNIIFVGSNLVGREYVRSYLINNSKKKENSLTHIFVALFMTVTGISLNQFINLHGLLDIVTFTAQYFAPEFAQNLFAAYLVLLGGPLASIIYLGVLQSFHWFSPILPDLKWITTALIGVLSPIFCLIVLQNIYQVEIKSVKKREKKNESATSLMITSIISIMMIWFAVGIFPIYPSVIVTGSMEPMIKPGDVILVKKVDANAVQVDDVIQFKRDSILISHRIIEVKEDVTGKSYQTKGDNNSGPDIEWVKPEQIKGKVISVIPKIGWPTLLFKSSREIPLEEIVF